MILRGARRAVRAQQPEESSMSKALKRIVTALGASALALCGFAATAHHSAAQFNLREPVTVEGTIKQSNVTNPHTIAVVEITDDARGTRDVEFEGHSASHFYRSGYTRGLAKPGDTIVLVYGPRHDGEDGGYILGFTVNGKTVQFGSRSPETGSE